MKNVSKIFEINCEDLIIKRKKVEFLFEIWGYLVCGGVKIMICMYFFIFGKYIGINILNKVLWRIFKLIILL